MGSRKKPIKKATRKAVKAAPRDTFDQDTLDEQEIQIEQEEVTKKILLGKIQELIKRHDRIATGVELVTNAIQDVWLNNPVLNITIPRRPVFKNTVKDSEVAAVFLSDIHYGKETPTFNSAVCEIRMGILADKIRKITQLRRNMADIRELRLYLGGDMLEGENLFAHQAHTIDMNLLDQSARKGPRMYTTFILEMLDIFDKVKVICVPGNHGRNGPKKNPSHPLTNWDRVLYEVLKNIFLGNEEHPRRDLEDRLEFVHNDEFYAVDHIGDWGVLLVHGDQIRGGHAGFPFYGTAKKVWGWTDALQDYEGIPESWDYLLFGHFHTLAFNTTSLKEWYANGSLETHNPYAQESLAQCGTPAQWLLFFDEKAGIISPNPLYVSPEYRKSDIQRARIKTKKYLGGKKSV